MVGGVLRRHPGLPGRPGAEPGTAVVNPQQDHRAADRPGLVIVDPAVHSAVVLDVGPTVVGPTVVDPAVLRSPLDVNVDARGHPGRLRYALGRHRHPVRRHRYAVGRLDGIRVLRHLRIVDCVLGGACRFITVNPLTSSQGAATRRQG